MAQQLVPDLSLEHRDVRRAMWSIYHHSFSVRTLGRSLVELSRSDLRPIPLDDALKIVIKASDDRANARRFRVFDRVGVAGFASVERMNELRRAAKRVQILPWLDRIEAVMLQVKILCEALHINWDQISTVLPSEFRAVLYSHLPAFALNCQVLYATCHVCYDPVDPITGRPLTTVTASALVSETPQQLAKVFDPRSWGKCFDNFQTQRVDYNSATGDYPPHAPDSDPIGQPWDPAKTQLFFERVTLESGSSSNVFDNILRIKSFTVGSSHTRLEFDLRESRKLLIPELAIDMNECVTVDEGYLDATAVAGPTGGTWSKLELVKRVQYVDVNLQGSKEPFGLDPGELLNYYAPAILCLWLEDAAAGAACCRV
jgi:hypothetical protein